MKMMMTAFAMISATSAIAHAGPGVSAGPSLCSFANVFCMSDDQKVGACFFHDNQSPDDLMVIDDRKGDDQDVHFPATIQPHDPKKLGSPLEISNAGVALTVVTDAAPSAQGFPGTLSVPKLGLENVALRCKVKP